MLYTSLKYEYVCQLMQFIQARLYLTLHLRLYVYLSDIGFIKYLEV